MISSDVSAIETYLEFFAREPECVELLIQERAQFRDRKQPTYFEHRDANKGRWEAEFRSLIAEGRVRDVPVERILDVLGDLIYGTMFANYFAGRKCSPQEQARDIVDITLNGILSDAQRVGNRETSHKVILSEAKDLGNRGDSSLRSE